MTWFVLVPYYCAYISTFIETPTQLQSNGIVGLMSQFSKYHPLGGARSTRGRKGPDSEEVKGEKYASKKDRKKHNTMQDR